MREMLRQYKDAGKFLFSTFMQHGVAETIAWFTERGAVLVEENEGRLFPSTHSAKTIFDTLKRELKTTGVTVKTRHAVKSIVKDLTTNELVVTIERGDTFCGRTCIVATGGTSRPETGATGDGYQWLRKLGHTVIENNFALVPLTLKNNWVKKLSGLTLPDVKLTIYAEEKKDSVHRGKLLFTHVGVTGPTILNLSKTVGELLAHSDVTIVMDLFPDEDAGEFKKNLQVLLQTNSNKKLRNALATILPTALVTALLEEMGIDGETPCHSVLKTDRIKLSTHLKAVPLHVRGLLGADKAVIASGGVALPEVDFKTMESRLVPGLFLVGDVLNIDRPSGGYSLQLCWSTGFVAGEHV